jgi:hypothetical protein
MAVVTPEGKDHVPASELLRDQLGSLWIDRLPPEVGHRKLEVEAERIGELVLVQGSQVDEHAAKHSGALHLDLERAPKLHLADQPLSNEPLTQTS